MSDTEEKPVADVEADEVEADAEAEEAPAADVPKEPLTINEGVQVHSSTFLFAAAVAHAGGAARLRCGSKRVTRAQSC